MTPPSPQNDLRDKAPLSPGASEWAARYRDTAEVGGAVVRLVKSTGRRVADEDPDSLALLVYIGDTLAEAWRTAIAGLRASGFSDGEIGAELGVTKQAVQDRWPR